MRHRMVRRRVRICITMLAAGCGLSAATAHAAGAATSSPPATAAASTLPAGEHCEGAHWLGTFAVYLTSQAGLPGDARAKRRQFDVARKKAHS